MLGKTIGRYHITGKLGEGGMGEVFLAEDVELKRQVALKFLPDPLISDREVLERFRREAQTTAGLNHPNIITVYEVGEHEKRPFIAMAYVDGEPLSEVIAQGELDSNGALDIAIQVAEGLRCAHDAGVVHRDIKPDNILIGKDGRARILDFGLAKLGGVSKLTQETSTMGTIFYMSPEQARGDDVDRRSDLFSLGSVLYEMLTGCRPFKGDHTASLIYSIINDTPRPISDVKPGMPAVVEQVLAKLFAKDVTDRYQSAEELIGDLHRIKGGFQPVVARRPRRMARVLVPTVIVFAAVILALVLKPFRLEISGDQDAVAGENALAIMYFENLAQPDDPKRIGEIATNLLITDLSESDYVRVVSSQRLYDILKLEGSEGARTVDRDTATRVATRAGARTMLLGSILQQEPSLIVTAQLVDVESGQVIDSYKVAGDEGETIFSIVDELTGVIKDDLDLPVAAEAEPDQPVANVTTHSTEAYRHYLEGIENANKLFAEEARSCFEKAVREDSTFAMAYRALGNLAATDEQRTAALEMARRYAENCTKKERLYIESSVAMAETDFPSAIATLERLVEEYPDEKSAYKTLGNIYRGLRQSEEAILNLSRAIEIDPLDKLAYNTLAYEYQASGDVEKSLWAINKYIELAPKEPNPYDTRGDLYALAGQVADAIASYGRAIELKPDFHHSLSKLGDVYLLTGRYDEAREVYRRLVAVGGQDARSGGLDGLSQIPLIQGKLELGEETLRQGIASDELEGYAGANHIWKWQALVRIAAERGEYEAAEAACGKLEPLAASLHEMMGMSAKMLRIELRCLQGDIDGARELLREIESVLDENDPVFGGIISYGKSLLAACSGDPAAAIGGFERVSEIQPNTLVRYRLGTACLDAGRLGEAVEHFETILGEYTADRAKTPILSVKAHYQLGRAYEASGWRDRAIEQYDAFLHVWRDADPVFDEIPDARKRLEALKRGS